MRQPGLQHLQGNHDHDSGSDDFPITNAIASAEVPLEAPGYDT